VVVTGGAEAAWASDKAIAAAFAREGEQTVLAAFVNKNLDAAAADDRVIGVKALTSRWRT